MSKSVRVEGLKELEKSLEELGKSAGSAQLRKALREGGEVLARDARARAPVLSGAVRESIHVGGLLTRSQRAGHRRKSTVEMHVGPGGHPQAITQEFGTFFHGAQPFMRPAWDSSKHVVLKRTTDALFVFIEKAVERARRRAAKAGKG